MATPGTQATALDIIKSALRMIGALASGETPSNAEASDALSSLNRLIDSWNFERLMIFTLNINEFSLVPGQQVYTLGTGGNFNIARPPRIERMSIVSLNNPAQPLELPLEMLTEAEWQMIPVKLIYGPLPLKVYDDGAFPYRNLSFWVIPTAAVNTRLYSWNSLSQFPDLTSVLNFPGPYLRALTYNLACEIAPEFGAELSQVVIAQAVLSKSIIKSANIPLLDLQCDVALTGEGGRFNYITGQ